MARFFSAKPLRWASRMCFPSFFQQLPSSVPHYPQSHRHHGRQFRRLDRRHGGDDRRRAGDGRPGRDHRRLKSGAGGGRFLSRMVKIFALTANDCNGNDLPRMSETTNTLLDRQSWMPDDADFHRSGRLTPDTFFCWGGDPPELSHLASGAYFLAHGTGLPEAADW